MLEPETQARFTELFTHERYDEIKAMAMEVVRHNLGTKPAAVAELLMLVATCHFMTRHYEQTLTVVDQTMKWMQRASINSAELQVRALDARAAAQWNLGIAQDALKTSMEAVRNLGDCRSPSLRFEALANAARMCLRHGSGDMAALFARQAWQTYTTDVPADHPSDAWFARFHYTIPMCLVAERGRRSGLVNTIDQVCDRMSVHLDPGQVQPRQLFIDYHVFRSESRLSSAQRALDELLEHLAMQPSEDGLWETYGMIAQARLDLDRGRPAHALQAAEMARTTAARNRRLDLEGEALQLWYEAYGQTGLPSRPPRKEVTAAVVPLERRPQGDVRHLDRKR